VSVSHLVIEDLWHKYDSYKENDWVLKSINFNLLPGELVGLLGPSGSGKTTLLRLIAGFENPGKGKIFLNGNQISSVDNVLPAEKRGIGMVFQDYALFPHLTVWQNVCFGLPSRFDLSRAEWLIELFGLLDLRKRYPHELSGGQKQRLALARALAPGNSLIVLDEPFCSLDVAVRGKLRNELSNVLNSCSATALIVTHDPKEALAICDRVAVMKNGELHQFSKPSEIVQSPSTAFVGKFVLQKNLLPIRTLSNKYKTTLGELMISNEVKINESPQVCMFGSDDIQISNDLEVNSVVVAKEFCNDHWIIILRVEDELIRLRHSLNIQINIGDKCHLSFKKGFNGLLFPGKIKCFSN